ncbi:MAG: class I SAM-dependent RNA methyltransferase, partial [Oscillospiraceae bacterium]|nr:class I SAM-dependent RNA methyltransferase [Oscillospiraceae bacterium]
MIFTATCLFGLEKFLGDEIDALGYKRIETIDGRVTFEGDIDAIPRCNLWFRYAERLFINMGKFNAVTFDELFEGTKSLPFEEWIGIDDEFPVKGHSIKSKLFSIPDCQSIIKKAVVERLKSKYNISIFKETGVKYQIEFFIFNDVVTLMIDTSGTPLHKRGYRPQAGIAPLRETLAAALAAISRPREDVLFWDPMCGSGTIPLEAALLMTNTAPGLQRSFAAETFPQIPASSWSKAREEALSLIKRDSKFEAFATDIDLDCVKLTETNVKNAGMENHVKAFRKDALTIKTDGRRGTVVCNPPYGERLFSEEAAEQLYRSMG